MVIIARIECYLHHWIYKNFGGRESFCDDLYKRTWQTSSWRRCSANLVHDYTKFRRRNEEKKMKKRRRYQHLPIFSLLIKSWLRWLRNFCRYGPVCRSVSFDNFGPESQQILRNLTLLCMMSVTWGILQVMHKNPYIKRFYYRSGKKLWSAVLTQLLFNLALFFAQFERYHTRFLNPMS